MRQAFRKNAAALESLDGFRYLIEARESKYLINPKPNVGRALVLKRL
jgi:hypothetical protein